MKTSRTASISSGSSPLARGLHNLLEAGQVRSRIIPARAGFTPPRPALFLLTRDHPRSRGVYEEIRAALFSALGSSPLARGLRDEIGSLLGGERIIPARAGFTFTILGDGITDRDHPRSRGVYSHFP